MPVDRLGSIASSSSAVMLQITSSGSASSVGRPVGVQALDVGEDDELLGAERDRERRGRGVGVDVVDLAVGAAGDAGHDRDAAVGEQPLHDAGVDRDDVADQAEVDLLAVDLEVVRLGGEQVRVLAGQPDRERAVRVDQADDLALHLADEHHPDDVHRLRGGDPEAGRELALDAEPVELRGDLRAAAVHDDRAQPGVAAGRRRPRRTPACSAVVGHRVAAELDDDGAAVEPLQPGQRLDEDAGLRQRLRVPARLHAVAVAHVEYAEFSWT